MTAPRSVVEEEFDRRAVWRKCSCAVPFFWTHWIDVVTRNKRIDRSATEPKAWWQRVLAGEPVPKDLFRQRSKCGGTVEDHRNIALDVRELIRHRVFDQPVGSIFRLNIRFPWLRMMRLNSCSFDLELVTGRTVIVPLVWASRVSGSPASTRCHHAFGSVAERSILLFRVTTLIQCVQNKGTAHEHFRQTARRSRTLLRQRFAAQS